MNSLQIEYDPRVIDFRQLLEVFWSSHDSRQVFGQGPDVGNQYRCDHIALVISFIYLCIIKSPFHFKISTQLYHYVFNFFFLLIIRIPTSQMLLNRSIIFVNGTEESRLAVVSKEREQTKSRGSIVTTQIQQLETFHNVEPEH